MNRNNVAQYKLCLRAPSNDTLAALQSESKKSNRTPLRVGDVPWGGVGKVLKVKNAPWTYLDAVLWHGTVKQNANVAGLKTKGVARFEAI